MRTGRVGSRNGKYSDFREFKRNKRNDVYCVEGKFKTEMQHTKTDKVAAPTNP